MGFHPRNALNSFFYRTQWLNIDRYGRTGISHQVGLGNFPLSRWFHLSNFSSYIYSNAAAVSTLIGVIVWGASHITWMTTADTAWVVSVTLVLLFSSTAYAMAFSRQNYNILGWMWLPVALFAMFNSFWLLAAVAWMGAALGSITVVILSLPIIIVHALDSGNPISFFAILPALLLLTLHLRPLLMNQGTHFSASVITIAKFIGAHSKGVKYKRHSMRLGLTNTYFLFVYAASVLILYISSGQLPLLPISALIIFMINQRFLRIADDQSVILLFITVMGAYLLAGVPDLWALLALWIAASPLPWFLGLASLNPREGLTNIVCHGPFDHDRLEKSWDQFFGNVPTASRVYFAFNNPEDHYERIFDGYRSIIELPLFVASKRKIHLFPDWHAVGETNYLNAPNCWGREISEVMENMNRWEADYAVIYHDSQKALDEEWTDRFSVVAEFDWSNSGLKEFELNELFAGCEFIPKWFLLKNINIKKCNAA